MIDKQQHGKAKEVLRDQKAFMPQKVVVPRSAPQTAKKSHFS